MVAGTHARAVPVPCVPLPRTAEYCTTVPHGTALHSSATPPHPRRDSPRNYSQSRLDTGRSPPIACARPIRPAHACPREGSSGEGRGGVGDDPRRWRPGWMAKRRSCLVRWARTYVQYEDGSTDGMCRRRCRRMSAPRPRSSPVLSPMRDRQDRCSVRRRRRRHRCGRSARVNAAAHFRDEWPGRRSSRCPRSTSRARGGGQRETEGQRGSDTPGLARSRASGRSCHGARDRCPKAAARAPADRPMAHGKFGRTAARARQRHRRALPPPSFLPPSLPPSSSRRW